MLTLIAVPFIQFQINGNNELVSQNKEVAQEAIFHDIYYMLREIGCENFDSKIKSIDCDLGVYQNIQLESALSRVSEYSKEVESLNYTLFFVFVMSGYILFFGFYFEFRLEYERDSKQKEINEWLDIAATRHDIRVRFKKS
ncbi:hypothetical protein ACFSJY_05155 [Thalassotalea euphylliae]|uniref:hypothetical protein n=1 Tax=Thalassotalea euphylliae TaxID=1655234 RepID=UPI003636A0A3